MANQRRPVHTSVNGLDVLAFAAELVLIWCAVRAGMQWAGPEHVLLGGIAGGMAVAVIWAVWMSPRAERRLRPRARAVVACLLAVSVALALVQGPMVWPLASAAAGVVLVTAALRRT